ncbi:MAG: triacylglycerol lipase [Solirubrobacteraceae bacterium]|jgi:pimeloyl-ACP methyl ester carboxylesterase|nr:triacylglycerol lipase [Solirubrobacteraceae bacterium]
MSVETVRELTPIESGWPGRPLAETRWVLEAWRLLADPVAYGVGVPHGDGRAVVVIPGFLASDETLWMLRAWLRVVGYDPYTCGFTFNVDCSDRSLDVVERVVQRAAHRSGRRVAVIGHSRGGHFARAVAARRPDLVSHAISLGADLEGMFGISSPTRSAVGMARRAVQWTQRSRSPTCFRSSCDCRFVRDYSAPFPEDVRLTSVFSKGDGVVRWQRATPPEATAVEVTGSHVGMAANRKVFKAIAEALALGELPRADDH